MKCAVCKRTSDEVQLYTGILKDEMVMICEECATSERIPVVKKPSESQLDRANKRYSVRERMERLSGIRDPSRINGEQIITQGNLAKLRMPPKKEHNDDILYNYYWTLNIARRRAKLSIMQLAKKLDIPSDIIQSIEKGKIPKDFEEIFSKLEIFFNIKLLKSHKRKINFIKKTDMEKQVLEDVMRKMGMKQDNIKSQDRIVNHDKKDLSDITIDKLVEMKKMKERQRLLDEKKKIRDSIIGDDLEIDTL